MRRILSIASLIAALAATSFASTATASTYITIEGTSVQIEDNLDGELNPVGMRFRFGSPIAKNLDMEAHVGFGADLENSAYDEFGTSYLGMFLKAYVPIGFNSAFYALGGYSAIRLTQNVNNQEFEDERYGLSYGAGMETRISERVDFTADYVRYIREEGLFDEISAVSFGLKVYF